MSQVEVTIAHTYDCGREEVTRETVPAPAGDLRRWWEDVVFAVTGTGHDPNCLSSYAAEITRADDAELVGERHGWQDLVKVDAHGYFMESVELPRRGVEVSAGPAKPWFA